MKRQRFCGPRSGKLVCQLPGGVTFAYDLCLGRSRDRQKGLVEGYNRGDNAWEVAMRKKRRLVPQNGPGSLGPEKP